MFLTVLGREEGWAAGCWDDIHKTPEQILLSDAEEVPNKNLIPETSQVSVVGQIVVELKNAPSLGVILHQLPAIQVAFLPFAFLGFVVIRVGASRGSQCIQYL